MSVLTNEVEPLAASVIVTDDELTVRLVDGRTISVPLVWFPRLLQANAAQRGTFELIGDGEGIHWSEIDEDISIAGLLRGVKAPSEHRPQPAA